MLGLVFGSTPRFLIGGVLLAGFLMWGRQNRLFDSGRLEQLKQQAAEVVERGNLEGAVDQLKSSADTLKSSAAEFGGQATPAAKPLEVPAVPIAVSRWFGGLAAGLAGLLLLISSPFGGVKMGVLMYPAAAVAGPALPIPPLAGFDPQWLTLAAAGALGLVALVFGRRDG